jgi:hypothetical protein
VEEAGKCFFCLKITLKWELAECFLVYFFTSKEADEPKRLITVTTKYCILKK